LPQKRKKAASTPRSSSSSETAKKRRKKDDEGLSPSESTKSVKHKLKKDEKWSECNNYIITENNVARHMAVGDILKAGTKYSSFSELEDLLRQCNDLRGSIKSYSYEFRVSPTYLQIRSSKCNMFSVWLKPVKGNLKNHCENLDDLEEAMEKGLEFTLFRKINLGHNLDKH
jgi:hypothetical protein